MTVGSPRRNAGDPAGATSSRAFALVALGAFALHLLRYLVAILEAGGGGGLYLGHVAPVLAGLGVGLLGARLFRARLRASVPARASTKRPPLQRAALFALAVLLAYLAQEIVDGQLSDAHTEGSLEILGHGGWCALPLAILIAPICLLLDRLFGRLESIVAPGGALVRRRRNSNDGSFPRLLCLGTRLSPLAFGLARRPPPLLLS